MKICEHPSFSQKGFIKKCSDSDCGKKINLKNGDFEDTYSLPIENGEVNLCSKEGVYARFCPDCYHKEMKKQKVM
ncbi:hypothetical protein KKC45_01890 [Patescibacteria group bacterium]|nr:hypothetical protein [Patescibacteria group bacterium]